MSSQDDDQDFRAAIGVITFAVLLAVGTTLGIGLYKSWGGTAKTAAPAAVVTDAAAPADATGAAADQGASVVVENGVVKFYFASGRSELPSGAVPALQAAIEAAKSGKRLVLSGFHDASGDPLKNAELAKQRALAVRAALLEAGVPETSVELKKPEEATGTGDASQARRVEVTISG